MILLCIFPYFQATRRLSGVGFRGEHEVRHLAFSSGECVRACVRACVDTEGAVTTAVTNSTTTVHHPSHKFLRPR